MQRFLIIFILLAALMLFAACNNKKDDGKNDANQANEQQGAQNALGQNSSQRPKGVAIDATDRWLDDYEAIVVSYEKKSSLSDAEADELQVKMDELSKKAKSEDAKHWRIDQIRRGQEISVRFADVILKLKGVPSF
jgi:hypothetical protein